MTEPDFFATVEGVDAAIRTGNRQRLRSAATTAVAALAVAGVVVVAPWQGPGSRATLTPARDPLATPSATPDHGTTHAGVPAAVQPTMTPTAVPTTGGSAAPQPSAAANPSAVPHSASPVVGRHSPITRGTSSIAADDLCQDDQTDAAQGWCLRYTGPATARRGHPVALRMALCRLGSFPTGTITFTSTREAQLSLSQAGWEAGQGEHYTEPGRTVTLSGTVCLTWTSTWDTRGADGFLVLPGSYGISLGIDTNQLGFSTLDGPTLQVTD